MRWAPFGPTPGSWPSSSMRSWNTPSYTARLVSVGPGAAGCARLAGWRDAAAALARLAGRLAAVQAQRRKGRHAGHAPGQARERGHLLPLQAIPRAAGRAVRGEDKVGDRLGALGGIGRV